MFIKLQNKKRHLLEWMNFYLLWTIVIAAKIIGRDTFIPVHRCRTHMKTEATDFAAIGK